MARKTIEVEYVRNSVNYLLENTEYGNADERSGAYGLLEIVLGATGNYKGFRYLDSEYAKPGDETDEYAPVLRKGYDATRRHYH